jgi:hypothetical protein
MNERLPLRLGLLCALTFISVMFICLMYIVDPLQINRTSEEIILIVMFYVSGCLAGWLGRSWWGK